MKRPDACLSSEQVIDAALAMVPVLRERADRTDRERRVPNETFAAIQAAGLLHIFKPACYGGFELGVYEFAKIGMELARGCPSSGWIFSLLCEHCWFISLFPRQAQDDVWGEDSYNVAAGSLNANPAASRVERAKGGYRLSGRFPFASGSDHAQWLLLGALVERDDGSGAPDACLFLVPKSELTVLDDWFVLGMRGTGSRSYLADDVFVPEHRCVRRDDLFAGRTEGPSLHPTFDLIQAPRDTISPFVSSAPTVGIALGAVEVFPDLIRGVRRRTGMLADTQALRLRLSESAAEAQAARLIVESDTRETMTYVHRREPLPPELQARLARDAAYVGVLSKQAVDRLHVALGTAAIFDGNPIQRALRDVHTALAQTGLHWDARGLGYADLLLGGGEAKLDSNMPLLP